MNDHGCKYSAVLVVGADLDCEAETILHELLEYAQTITGFDADRFMFEVLDHEELANERAIEEIEESATKALREMIGEDDLTVEEAKERFGMKVTLVG